MKNNIREKIVLAALLHDIGKFWQRGDENLSKSKNFSNPNQEWGWLVPYNVQTNRPGYQHAIWTWQFFEKHKAKFSDLGFELGRQAESIQGISAKHHLPDTLEGAFIQMADRWSSAIDRRKEELIDEEDVNQKAVMENWGNYGYKKIPLYSIFNNLKVTTEKGDKTEELQGKINYAFNLKPLSIDESDIFPEQLTEEVFKAKKERGLQKEYEALWVAFEEEFSKIPTGSFNGFFISLLSLLKKYTWCIPSSTMDMPNVSLFEHLKTTAAFASCLFDFYLENENSFTGDVKQIKLKQDTDPVLMCCLDISGIQKFIYDVASRKAAQSLKGRSFYLQLLLDNLLDFILSNPKVNQTKSNIIYSSGGMAYFILPNTESVKSGLGEAFEQIQSFIWEEHKGKIFPALSWIPFRYEFHEKQGTIRSNHIEGKNIDSLGSLWKKVADLTGVQKRKRFKKILLSDFDDFFSNNGKTAKNSQVKKDELCEVTGEPIVGKKGRIYKMGDTEVVTVLPSVEHQVELGKKLKNSNILAKWLGTEDKLFHALKTNVRLLDNIDKTHKSNPTTIFSFFNNTDFLVSHSSDQCAYTFNFYGGNKQPYNEQEDRPKTLEELCKISSNSEEFSKLGILRMDVDNLGKIFKDGFNEHDKSFAAYATLSFYLDLFFSGFINQIWNSEDKYREHVSILYSGGDDVFALGRWDTVLDFGVQIRKQFEVFTGREDITLSAGLAIVDRKYPIYKAAELAKEAEDNAKGYTNAKLGNKNALCFFEETVSWKEEFEYVQHLKNDFLDFIQHKGLGRSLLHQLQRYKALKDYSQKRHKEEGKPLDFSYKWHSAYYLKRFAERHEKKQKVVNELIYNIQKRLLHDSIFDADRYLDLVALAARWAEYELKIKQPKEQLIENEFSE